MVVRVTALAAVIVLSGHDERTSGFDSRRIARNLPNRRDGIPPHGGNVRSGSGVVQEIGKRKALVAYEDGRPYACREWSERQWEDRAGKVPPSC